MAKHENFYETTKEANIRLKGTVVLYDKEPYNVLCITDHKKDGIFRIYMIPAGVYEKWMEHVPGPLKEYGADYAAIGTLLDEWLDVHKNSPVLRKQMNSPLFNKYRPFPLGMCNFGKHVFYVERQPLRPKTEQGLTKQMLDFNQITLGPKGMFKGNGSTPDVMHASMRACITAEHPTAKEALSALLSDKFDNEALAFNRDFAFLKGPIGLVFLAYKADVIGVLPKSNFDFFKLGNDFKHCSEVVESLGLFANIIK